MRWLRRTLAFRLLVLALLAGILTSMIAGLALRLASAPRGSVGIATFVVMCAVTFFKRVASDCGPASVAGIALGRSAADGTPWSRRARVASTVAMLAAGAPIIVGIAAMPRSGDALDLASGVLVVAVFSLLVLSTVTSSFRSDFGRLTRNTEYAARARERRRRQREERRRRTALP